MVNLPTGTVTFLLTDIQGSTRLWQDQPAAMRTALARHDALLHDAIAAHGGHVYNTVGDAFCAAFARPTDAIATAAAAQAALQAEAWPLGAALYVRMALHIGHAVLQGGDYFGPAVDHAKCMLPAVHGGQVVLTGVLEGILADQALPGLTFRDLGAHQLKDLSRPVRLFQLLAPGIRAEFPPLATLDRQAHNLPVQLTDFVGRRRELAALAELLAEARLLTLTGVGGTGKTRLALQLAADVAERFPDGVWLAELAALTDADGLAAAIATSLGVQEQPGRDLEDTLGDHFGARHMLLILDNCEHVLDKCARLCEGLLRSAPDLRILATSREAMGVRGEVSWPVSSLSLPESTGAAGTGLDEAARSEAVQLFVQRAYAAQPQFELNAERLPAVVQICRRLDGIPLALELAAARLRMLSAEQIASRLDDRFRLLTGGNRTALPRHQTLSATLDWSYDLLEEDERTVFRRLSVFRGGWTLEAAEAVACGGGIEECDVLDLLSRLVDKSLVNTEEGRHGLRYRYLETMRQYARDALVRSPEAEAVRDAHLAHFLAIARAAEAASRGPDQERLMATLEAEHDNMRAALDRALAAGSGEAGMQLGVGMWRFWYLHGFWAEGRARLESILAQAATSGSAADEAACAHLLNAAGALANAQGDYDSARRRFEKSLAIRRELNDKAGIATTLSNLAVVALDQGDTATARVLQDESLALRRELGDPWPVAATLGNLGAICHLQGNLDAARSLYAESLALHRDLGDRPNTAMMLSNLGIVAGDQGDHVAARRLHGESLDLCREVGDREGVAAALTGLGWAALGMGDPAAAADFHLQSLAISTELGHKRRQTECIEVLGWLAAGSGEAERAAHLMGAAEAQWQALGVSLSDSHGAGHRREAEAQALAALGAAAYRRAWDAGRAMSREAALALAAGTTAAGSKSFVRSSNINAIALTEPPKS